MKPRILLVDDDAGLRRIVRDLLSQEEMELSEAGSVREAMTRLEEEPPDLTVLDLSLPDGDGLELLWTMQAHPRWKFVPVVCLTSRAASAEVVQGLDLGADDYISKPFRERELVSRVRAVLRRRSLGEADVPDTVLEAAGIRMEVGNRSVTAGGHPVSLTEKEFDLLKVLMKKAGQILSREKLVELAWGHAVKLSPRVVDVHVAHLRRKLGEKAKGSIRSVPQAGYLFQVD